MTLKTLKTAIAPHNLVQQGSILLPSGRLPKGHVVVARTRFNNPGVVTAFGSVAEAVETGAVTVFGSVAVVVATGAVAALVSVDAVRAVEVFSTSGASWCFLMPRTWV